MTILSKRMLDHSLIAWGMAHSHLRWTPYTHTPDLGELSIDGIEWTTELDPYGVPKLLAPVRIALIEKHEATHRSEQL